MSLTVTLVPGFVFSSGNPGEELTYPNLNLLGSPTITLAGTIDSSQLGDGAVTTSKIADDAVTGAKIADDSIGLEHLVHQSAGSLFSFDGSGIPTTIPIGPSGYILTSDGSQASWQSSASFSVYPGDLSSSLTRTSIASDDTFIVGDTSAGVAKKIEWTEIQPTYYCSQHVSNAATSAWPAFHQYKFDRFDGPVTMATWNAAMTGPGAAENNTITAAPFTGSVKRITVTNTDSSGVGSCDVTIVSTDTSIYSSGAGSSKVVATFNVVGASPLVPQSQTYSSSNTFSLHDLMFIHVDNTSGGYWHLTVEYGIG